MRNMPSSKLVFIVAFFAACPLAFLFTRHMEATHRFDSLGLWYTLYVSAVFAIVAAALIVFATLAVARFRSRRFRVTR
jgi:hypothetical protein